MMKTLSEKNIFIGSVTLVIAGLFLAWPAAAVPPDPPSCTAADRGITSFSCPGTPTEDICGIAPNYTCYTGASEPCDFTHYTFNCNSCTCQCKTAIYPCTGCTDPTSDPAGTVSCAGNPNCPTGGVYADRCSATPACPTGQVNCQDDDNPFPGKCVNDNHSICDSFPGTTWEPCTNTCTSPYILRNPSPTQSNASIDITGDIQADSDLYINNGRAIHVDDGNISWLQVGNWLQPDYFNSLNLNVLGNVFVRDWLGVGGGFHNETDSPQYPLDLKSYESTAILNLADMDGYLWTGVRMARVGEENPEKWFIGMDDSGSDDLRFGYTFWNQEGYSTQTLLMTPRAGADPYYGNGVLIAGEGGSNEPTFSGYVQLANRPTVSPCGSFPYQDCPPGHPDFAGTDGTMYYNTSMGKLRCLEDGDWKDCVTDGGLGGAGSGSAGQVAVWQDGISLYGSSRLFWDDTDKLLGVGTDAPDAHLSVASDGDYSLTTANFVQTGAPPVYGTSFANNVVRIYRNLDWSSTGPNSGALLSVEDSGAGGSTGPLIEARLNTAPVFIVDTSGNIGVGTGAPQRNLDIRSGTYGVISRLTDVSGSRIWTGTALARGANEKWFIGMNATDDSLRLRAGGSSDAVSVQANPGAAYRLNLLSPGGFPIPFGDSTAVQLRSDFGGEVWVNAIDLFNGTGTVAEIGTYASYFLTNVGVGTSNPFASLDVKGTGILTTAFKMPTGAQAGYTLTSDASGVASWQPGIGSIDECTGGKFHHVAGTSYNGSGIGGYTAAAAKCQLGAGNAGTHMCTSEEILRTIVCTPASITGLTSSGWINNGPPGFTSPASNDCAGWTSSASNVFGDFWQFSSTGGKGFATGCNISQPIICCK